MSSPLDAPLTIRRTSLHHLHPIREAHRGPNLSHCLIWRGAGERLDLVDDPGRQCRSALVAGHGRETMDYPARNEEGLSYLEHLIRLAFDLEHQGCEQASGLDAGRRRKLLIPCARCLSEMVVVR